MFSGELHLIITGLYHHLCLKCCTMMAIIRLKDIIFVASLSDTKAICLISGHHSLQI